MYPGQGFVHHGRSCCRRKYHPQKVDPVESDHDDDDVSEDRVRQKDTLFEKVRDELVFHPHHMNVTDILDTQTQKGWFTENGSGKITPTLNHILYMDYPHRGWGFVRYSVWMIHVEYLDCIVTYSVWLTHGEDLVDCSCFGWSVILMFDTNCCSLNIYSFQL